MKLHENWLIHAYYSDKYITDGVLFVNRQYVWGDKYRLFNPDWDNQIDKLFDFIPMCKINKFGKQTRKWANTKISKYPCSNGYVILNDEYSYLWSNFDINLYTNSQVNKQYNGPVAIVQQNNLLGIIAPIIIEDKNIENNEYWTDVDKGLGILN